MYFIDKVKPTQFSSLKNLSNNNYSLRKMKKFHRINNNINILAVKNTHKLQCTENICLVNHELLFSSHSFHKAENNLLN